MTEFKRLISYLYEYEGKVKGKNVGFVKLETRNGLCKLNVSIRKLYLGSGNLGVYLLSARREIFLGNLILRNGGGEFRTTLQAADVEQSGDSIEDCYGLTIHEKKDSWKVYTTIWEDSIAQAAELTSGQSRGQAGERISGQSIARAAERTSGQSRGGEAGEEISSVSALSSVEKAVVQAAEVAFAPVKENRAAEMMAGTESANESEIRIRDNGEEKRSEQPGRSAQSKENKPFKGSERLESSERTEKNEVSVSDEWQKESKEPEKSKYTKNELNAENFVHKNQKEEAEGDRKDGLNITVKETLKGNGKETVKEDRKDKITEMTTSSNRPQQSAGNRITRSRMNSYTMAPRRSMGLPRENQQQERTRMGNQKFFHPPVLGQQPLNPQVQGGAPLNAQLLSQQPLSQQPLSQQPLNTQPLSQQPLSTQPLSHQPLNTQPLNQQPLSQQSMNQQPLNQQPLNQQPLNQQSFIRQQEEEPLIVGDPEALAKLEEEEKIPPVPLWDFLSKTYPKIQAFESQYGCEILVIKPQDIGLLPREVWIYGNNSFLLHGYYNYRYLILARLENPQGFPRYLLGVPGHYFNNEKYMASMFGFPNFVLSKKQQAQDGRFGYWYTDIRLGEQNVASAAVRRVQTP